MSGGGLEPYQIIKSPVLTEESQIHTESQDQYTFKVDARANKQQIRDAIMKLYPEVLVVAVNTMNYQGKLRRRGRHIGRRPSWKKAVVTLRRGDSIELL
jgi:large subunit ribosomal protein L23